LKKNTYYFPVILVACLSLLTLAASVPTIGFLIESISTQDFPTIEVRLSAWNAGGLPLAELEKNNFQISENGGTHFSPDEVLVDKNAPLSVILVLDISGSMIGQPLVDAKVAAARFLDRLTPGDQVALIAFSDSVNPDPSELNPDREVGFTSNLTPVYDLVENLPAEGGTHLYNAVTKAVRLAYDHPAGHRAVLVVSDGVNDPADVGDPQAPIQLAKDSNIPIFVIGLGYSLDEPYLRRLTAETGGVLRLTPRSSELAQTFDDMAALLKTQYVLTYTSGITSGADSLDLSIELNALGSQATDNIIVVNIPPLPTPMPTDLPTEPPTPTATPTEIPEPTNTPSALESTDDDPGSLVSKFVRDMPVLGWGVLLLGIAGASILLIRVTKRKPVTLEKCARCGFTLPENASVCPQCGESRQIKFPDQRG
jgi:uncharacterized protein YegL